ncbi:aminoglycoside phosphotransferase [Pseudolysobacter antarcticus]|uniref:Aminoglycoside phosphotransferase n=1 Tax=Pseudolysobacter antarcticus TaxID=2511995 RepID=A0A411HGR1_9GAMM|nr:phosphotransferase [Pseudolysobacter antarcticus]QBB69661.1 aminoglycoside phosphotransferase [Pseudolysobacter antarcticus]
MSTDRENAMREWLTATLGRSDYQLERASVDASFRRYLRLSVAGSPTRIVMDAPPATEKLNTPIWLDVATRLRSAGLNTPEVFAQDLERGFLLISDLGARPYLDELNEKTVDQLYADALAALLSMQTKISSEQLPPFNEAWLTMELELMPQWFLQRHLGHALNCDEWDIIELAFRTLINSAQAQPHAFMHRDFHSRNLMITNANNPGIIDFQGAMRGPITYDLASLLRDCYIAWPQARIDVWVEDYRQRLAHAGITHSDSAQFRRWFDLIGLQRHIKVLGIFCRLWYRDGKPGYLKDLPLVLRYVISVAQRYPELGELAVLLERAIGVRDITEPRNDASMAST